MLNAWTCISGEGGQSKPRFPDMLRYDEYDRHIFRRSKQRAGRAWHS